MKQVNYLRDEMNAYAKGMKLPEISEFYRGWRAACEAMANRQGILDSSETPNSSSPPQPVADWRERCVVERCGDGFWSVLNEARTHVLLQSGKVWYCYSDGRPYIRKWGTFETEFLARAALTACPTPPPGVQA